MTAPTIAASMTGKSFKFAAADQGAHCENDCRTGDERAEHRNGFEQRGEKDGGIGEPCMGGYEAAQMRDKIGHETPRAPADA